MELRDTLLALWKPNEPDAVQTINVVELTSAVQVAKYGPHAIDFALFGCNSGVWHLDASGWLKRDSCMEIHEANLHLCDPEQVLAFAQMLIQLWSIFDEVNPTEFNGL